MLKGVYSKKGYFLFTIFLLCILSLLFFIPSKSLYADQLFGKLDITEISLKGHKLHIRGETDLPPGSTLNVKVSIPKLDDDKGKDHDVKVNITPGHFFIMIDLPKEWKNKDWVKFLKLKAVFDPWEQPENVKVKVGKNGEKLSGPKVKVEKGKKIMISIKNVIF